MRLALAFALAGYLVGHVHGQMTGERDAIDSDPGWTGHLDTVNRPTLRPIPPRASVYFHGWGETS